MARLAVSFRIALILLIALSALWLLLIAFGYLATDLGRGGALPEPGRLAALAELCETAAVADRARLARAVESPTLRLRFAGSLATADADGAPAAERLARPYRQALGGRELVLVRLPRWVRERRFPRLYAAATNAAEFRIRLRGGEWLIVESRGPVAMARMGLPVGFGAGLLGTLLALAALVSLHRDIRPLVRLAAVLDRVDPTRSPIPIPPLGARAPEVRALVGAFERLQGRLATLVRARLALIGGLQHDVRTFATRLRLRVETIPDPDERRRAEADIADIIQLLDDALLASRAGVRQLDQELIEIAPLVAREVADRRQAGAAVDLSLSASAHGALVLGDRLALRRILANLIGNALEYGRVAHLGLAVAGDVVVLTVDDEGPGIPPARRERLLEPFVRRDDAPAGRTGGAGLGLAVVRHLVESHEGTLAIDDGPFGGARVVVRLPLFEAE